MIGIGQLKLVFVYFMVLFQRIVGQYGNPSCSRTAFHIKDGVKDRLLDSHVFLTTTINNNHECFLECKNRCSCLSFNVCGTQCQLNTNRIGLGRSSLKKRVGCTYYEFPQNQLFNPSIPLCCLEQNPCVNGGQCVVNTGEYLNERRFRCECPAGYYGTFCEIRNPKSCADFVQEQTRPLSGIYNISDTTMKPFPVFCDFDSEPDFVWTLLMSFSRDQILPIKYHGLQQDYTVNMEGSFLNWSRYRLSLTQMTSIGAYSSHWRATCAYDMLGYYENEYVRVNLSHVDPLSYYTDGAIGSSACQTIEYVDLFGSICHQCNFALYHYSGSAPHLIPGFSTTWSGCQFDMQREQVFCQSEPSYYFTVNTQCLDTKSECQSTPSSTTQNWFGVKLV